MQKRFDAIASVALTPVGSPVSPSVRDFPSVIPSDFHSARPLLVSGGDMDYTIQLLESSIPAAAAAAAVSQKAPSDNISGTKRGSIDPPV